MSKTRVIKYQDSIRRFIFNNNNSPFSNEMNKDSEVYEFLDKLFDQSDKYLSILLLTVLNSQNKKNKLSIQGYYAACGIEIIYLLFNIYDNKENLIKKHGDIINDITVKLSFSWVKSIKSNLDVSKRHIHKSKFDKVNSTVMNMITEDIPMYVNRESNKNLIQFQSDNEKAKSDIPSFYLDKNEDLCNKFKQLRLIKKESIKETILNTICNIGVLSSGLGWSLGGGSDKKLNSIKEIGKYFSLIYQLGCDFENIDTDIINGFESDRKYTFNFVVNSGFQYSYETYLEYKETFIVEASKLELYNITVKELICNIDEKVDNAIDNTSPDIKSTLTTNN